MCVLLSARLIKPSVRCFTTDNLTGRTSPAFSVQCFSCTERSKTVGFNTRYPTLISGPKINLVRKSRNTRRRSVDIGKLACINERARAKRVQRAHARTRARAHSLRICVLDIKPATSAESWDSIWTPRPRSSPYRPRVRAIFFNDFINLIALIKSKIKRTRFINKNKFFIYFYFLIFVDEELSRFFYRFDVILSSTIALI